MKKTVNYDKREFLSLQEAEEVYGIPVDTLRKWIKRDGTDGIPKLEAFKPGKEVMIPKKAIDLYIKKFPAA